MVLHSQTRVVTGESAALAAKENIKTVLMEQTILCKQIIIQIIIAQRMFYQCQIHICMGIKSENLPISAIMM